MKKDLKVKLKNNDGTLSQGLLLKLKEKEEKLSKAEKVRSLLTKQRGLLKKKESLTEFDEPVLDLHRRNGNIETYEKATAGKFTFTHSNGEERFIELRPSDQETRDYGGRKVRWYTCHEDRPFAGWENPVVDSETVMLGYEKTKATDLKYQERIQSLKNKAKLTWVWIIIGIAAAIFIIIFAISSFAPELWDRIFHTGKYAVQPVVEQVAQNLSKPGV